MDQEGQGRSQRPAQEDRAGSTAKTQVASRLLKCAVLDAGWHPVLQVMGGKRFRKKPKCVLTCVTEELQDTAHKHRAPGGRDHEQHRKRKAMLLLLH